MNVHLKNDIKWKCVFGAFIKELIECLESIQRPKQHLAIFNVKRKIKLHIYKKKLTEYSS